MASPPTEPTTLGSFETFIDGWQVRHRTLHQQLLLSISMEGTDREEKQKDLVKQVLHHYQQYYEEKTKLAKHDVFLVFSAPWMSSYERTMLWIAGFKPSVMFRLLESAVTDLTLEQTVGVREVKVQAQGRERELTDVMASIQESVAAPPLLGLMRVAGRMANGQVSEQETAMEELRIAMMGVLESADVLRGWMMRKVMGILSPSQTVMFFAAVAEFQFRIRSWGLQRESQNHTQQSF